ncbi:MAG: Hsp20/alpha crystallin family protein [Candidatus Aminicenantes bacterium]|nr:Hsp20/alpha crystallin family protein [Candidatus Aminicenantes bacterium]
MAKNGVSEFDRLNDEMNRFLEYLRSTQRMPAGFSTSLWKPNINICESESHYIVEAEIPGAGAGNVQVSVKDDILTIAGERAAPAKSSQMRYIHMEIPSGPFKREIRLPVSLDPDAVTAESKDGMLRISLAKPQQVSIRREIKIQSDD